MRWLLSVQDELGARTGRGRGAAEPHAPRAHGALDSVWADELHEGVDLFGRREDLEDEGVAAHVDDADGEDVAQRGQLGTALGRRGDLEERELTLEPLAGRELRDAQHIDEL